jgi:hypothetical protein
MANTYTKIHIQVVFAVKNRMSLINKKQEEHHKMSFIFVFRRDEVAASRLGKALLCGVSLFFAVRLVAGVVFWNGNPVITGVLALCILLYLVPSIMKER